MLNDNLKHIINSVTKKYQTLVHIASDNEVLNFPNSQLFPTEYLKAQTNVDTDTVYYFYINNILFAQFSYIDAENVTHKVFTGISKIDFLNYPILTTREFIEFLSVLYYLLTNKKLPETPSWLDEQTTETQIDLFSKSNIDSFRVHDPYADSIEFEKRYLDAILRNEPNTIMWMTNKVSSIYSAQLSTHPLQNVKFKCVGMITLITRLSINKGVTPMRAYALSDTLIQSLEDVPDIESCIKFMYDASLIFMQLIHEFPYADKSPLVKSILLYIDNNIYGNITLSSISKHMNKHQTYISSTFKQEMNETIHAYITKKKIFEAKHLLIFTNQSYKDIAALLNFSSQSHFISIFKSLENITPAEYRNIGFFKYLNL